MSSAASFPANWIKIVQRSYNHGSKQLGFIPANPVHFITRVNPGINLGAALRKDLSSLNDGNDPVLKGTSAVISLRLLVGIPYFVSPGTTELTPSKFSGYPDGGDSCQVRRPG